MTFTPSPDQAIGIQKFKSWFAGKDPKFFSLLGCAGTGKTTVTKHLVDSIGGIVHFASPTGKAAQVQRDAGLDGATTVHSLIYVPQDRSKAALARLTSEVANFPQDGSPEQLEDLRQQLRIEEANVDKPSFLLKSDSELRHAALVVIDECSMIDEKMGTDILSFGCPVLALGDPGQLPPIRGEGYFVQRKPDHLLTDVHRQALDSPILQMATKVRTGEYLPYGEYGQNCRVVDRATPEMAMEADQIIVGRNATRRSTNRRMRELLGREGNPVKGDKLVCLRNNHEAGFMNGSLWTIGSAECSSDTTLLSLAPFQRDGKELMSFAHMHYFQDRIDELGYYEKRDADEFDYGYAITCHKSQGSQWDNILVIDESTTFRHDARRWLYTAITRACKSVTVVRAK